MYNSLLDKVVFITGGSRGIGRSIALRAAQDGAKVVLAAKSAEPNPKLPGTIYSVAKEIENAGGQALPCVVDIRFQEQVEKALDETVKKFGGVDILVNNASAISLTNTLSTPMKSYDLMMDINARGTYMCSKLCIPLLKKSSNPHILTLSPPLNMAPKWFSNHLAYTMAKYGMSMCVLGMAKELQAFGIAVNALWPRYAVYTAATKMLGGEKMAKRCRHPEIMSDAAHSILVRPSRDPKNTGNFFIDDDVLRKDGITDFSKYSIEPGASLAPDFYLDMESNEPTRTAEPTMKMQDVLAKMKSMLSEDVVKTIGASFYFNLSGLEPGQWYLDLRTGKGSVGSADETKIDQESFDCRFSLTSENFIRMFTGHLSPSKAFMSGEMNLDGDVLAAIKLEKFMKVMHK